MRAIFVQFTPLGVLLKGKSKLRKRKRWVVVPSGSNFFEFKLPSYPGTVNSLRKMSLLIYGNAARSVTWYMKRHTQSFSTIRKQLPTFFHLCALAVLAGLWIFQSSSLTFRRRTKKMTVGAREHWRGTNISGGIIFIRKQMTVSSTLRRSNAKYLSRNIFPIAPSQLASYRAK